ncbi:MAG: DKNYY domain-containing protein [Patescibacteria group bacterium]
MKNFFTTKNIFTSVILLLVVGISAFFLIKSTFSKNQEKAKKIEIENQQKEFVLQKAIDKLSRTLTEPYSIKDGEIYYQSTLMEVADIVTFEPFPDPNRSFSKDKSHVYYVTKILEGADPATFEFFNNGYIGLARDKNMVYINDTPIIDADPKTFSLIKGTAYFKDKTYVFLNTKKLPGADPGTFEPVSSTRVWKDGSSVKFFHYSKDKNAIYFLPSDSDSDPIRIPNSDPATFIPITDQRGETLYFKDKNQIYHIEDGPLEGSDPTTFQFLTSGYSRDVGSFYYKNMRIPLVDVATFKVLGDGYAEDKNYIYHEEKIIFDLSKSANPFEQAATHILDITPKGDIAIDYIVNTYYDLTLYYGNCCNFNIFELEGEWKDSDTFFNSFFKELKRSTFDLAEFVPFRIAFVASNSPASLVDFPQPIGPGIGGNVVGRKLLDSETMLVYGRSGSQGYLGPSAYLCKESGDNIDKFIFKKVNEEWKIWEIDESIDQWMTNNEGDTEEECKEINQDRIEKYKI